MVLFKLGLFFALSFALVIGHNTNPGLQRLDGQGNDQDKTKRFHVLKKQRPKTFRNDYENTVKCSTP